MDTSQHLCSFVPLAVTNMSDKALCVAGVNPTTNKWIRPVEAGYNCIFENHLAWFPHNTLIKAEFGSGQTRSKKDDPYGLHREDMPIVKEPTIFSKLTPLQKLSVLERAADEDFLASLATSERSLFLVHIRDFKFFVDKNLDVRLKYCSGGETDSESLARYLEKDLEFLGISSKGIPCRMRGCSDFVSTIRRDERIVGMGDLLAAYPNARVYFAFSLSSFFKDKHWIILAGIHVIGEEIWL